MKKTTAEKITEEANIWWSKLYWEEKERIVVSEYMKAKGLGDLK